MYLEIAVGSPSNRGTLIPKDELKNYLMRSMSDKEPLFRSTYLYTDES